MRTNYVLSVASRLTFIAHPEQITARFAGEFERLLLHVLAGTLAAESGRTATTP